MLFKIILNSNDAQLLLTTSRRSYSINLLRLDKPENVLYEAPFETSILHTAISCNTDIYWIEQIETPASAKLRSLKKEVIETYGGMVRPLVKVNEQKIFVASAEKLHVMNCLNDTLLFTVLDNGNKEDKVNIGCQPVVNKQRDSVYLFGAKTLWQVDIDNAKLTAHPKEMQSTGDECLAISDDGKILVARSDGF